METILFIPYHIESHIRPTIVLKNILHEKYSVVYALPSKFKWLADAQQLEYINLESVPFGYGFEQVVRKQEGSKKIRKDALSDRRKGRIVKHREKKLKEVLDVTKPCFIFLDMLSSTDFILLYPWLRENKSGIAIINPMLSTYTIAGVPRIGSLLSPQDNLKTRVENLFVRAMFNIFKIKEYLKWIGYSNHSMINKEFKRKNIPHQYRPVTRNYVANFFNEIPELIIAPEELEFFKGHARKTQHYIGLLPDAGSRLIDDPVFSELSTRISSWKQDAATRIIFCAFGSMHGPANIVIANFLQRLFLADVKKYNLKIICAFADNDSLIDKEKLPSHVHMYNRLPQQRLLPFCDLFITHAGMGSIKEAIASETPMLTYPFTRDWDSTGNAVKITWHGLGLKGNIVKDSPELIVEKITAALSDPCYKKKITELKQTVESRYSKEKFLLLFENLRRKEIN